MVADVILKASVYVRGEATAASVASVPDGLKDMTDETSSSCSRDRTKKGNENDN